MARRKITKDQLMEDARLITRSIAYITIAARNLERASVEEAPETLMDLAMELADLMDVVNKNIAIRMGGDNIIPISEYMNDDAL